MSTYRLRRIIPGHGADDRGMFDTIQQAEEHARKHIQLGTIKKNTSVSVIEEQADGSYKVVLNIQ